MEKQQVLAKLTKQTEQQRAKLLAEAKKLARRKPAEYFDPKHAAQRKRVEASRLNRRTIAGLTYKVSNNYFSNARGTCGFDPESMSGHSYRWYMLVRKIKGQVILNDFRYSSQTSIHIWRTASVMKTLGIKYVTLQAPRGLQDLDAAVKYELSVQAERIVRNKYARNKSKRALSFCLRESEKNIKLLAKLGYKTTQEMRDKALEDAEAYRVNRNERLRERAKEKKAMAALEIIVDTENKRAGEAGIHVISLRGWEWNEADEFVGKVSDYDRRRAVSQGFTKIFVHNKEPRHLSVVS